uniref:Uncharacterized protein n=1 Tax=Siphoviridae sp. ct4SH8 TaxID=2827776 RepID=A0A8S5SYE6_9CAUD|nr:MAG TPA: hypothetical protein [Siphoviridae sp. ct4SH8]
MRGSRNPQSPVSHRRNGAVTLVLFIFALDNLRLFAIF